MIPGAEWAFSLLVGGSFLAGIGLVVAWTISQPPDSGRGFRSLSPIFSFPFLRWVEGLIVGLFLIPLLLGVGSLLLGVRIDAPAVGGILFLLILGGWWRATHSRKG